MDSHSLDIIINGDSNIGFYQWHPDRPPRIVIHEAMQAIALTDMEEILRQGAEWRCSHASK